MVDINNLIRVYLCNHLQPTTIEHTQTDFFFVIRNRVKCELLTVRPMCKAFGVDVGLVFSA